MKKYMFSHTFYEFKLDDSEIIMAMLSFIYACMLWSDILKCKPAIQDKGI